MFKCTQRVWDIIGEILAVLLVVTWAVWIINEAFPFINNVAILNVINFIRNYGSLTLTAVVGFEAMSKRNIVLQIIFLVLLAIVIIFSFFPEAFSSIVGTMRG